jgi:hypothetical protein
MAEPSPESAVVKTIGPVIATAVGWLIGLLPGGLTGSIGSALTTLLGVAGGISGLIFSLMYKRYIGVLAASAHDRNPTDRNARAERQAYDDLRKSLRRGNIAARLYTDWLTTFLDKADCFFRDRMSPQRAFGLKAEAPLWTAPAFDRCLLLALIYPLATVTSFWTISRDAGLGDLVLGLPNDIHVWWRRAPYAVMVGLFFGALGWSVLQDRSVKHLVPVCLGGAVFFGLVIAWARGVDTDLFTMGFLFTISFTMWSVGMATFAIAQVRSGAGALAFAMFYVIAGAFTLHAYHSWGSTSYLAITVASLAIAVAFIVAGAVARGVQWLSDKAVRCGRGWQASLLWGYFFAMLLASFGGAFLLSQLSSWSEIGVQLLFMGTLTLINEVAPMRGTTGQLS